MISNISNHHVQMFPDRTGCQSHVRRGEALTICAAPHHQGAPLTPHCPRPPRSHPGLVPEARLLRRSVQPQMGVRDLHNLQGEERERRQGVIEGERGRERGERGVSNMAC